jgi:hypothetical protein
MIMLNTTHTMTASQLIAPMFIEASSEWYRNIQPASGRRSREAGLRTRTFSLDSFAFFARFAVRWLPPASSIPARFKIAY